MATIRDVSKLAGVSVATVSRYLNQSGYVSKEAEGAIVAAIEKLNYKPNNIARSLAGKKTATIGLMVPDILNPFFPEIARAAEDTANKYGYTVILCNTDNNIQKEKNYIDTLVHKQVDGIIISSYTIEPGQVLSLQNRSIPVVVMDKAFPGHPIVSLASDNRKGGRLAAKHLADQGCRKIGHIAGPTHISSSRERTLGYEEVYGKAEWFTPSLMSYGDFSVTGGYKAMLELYEKHPDLDGVFAANDLMAAGALKALKRLGVSVPDEVKLIGFDGIRMDMVYPEISTVSQQIYSLGESAMNFLIKLIKGEELEKKVYEFDVDLMEKDSTKGAGQ